MTYILNIETATKNCSVAIAKNGNIIAKKEIANQNYSHAELLHSFIEELMCESTIKFKELSAIAVSQGPGSYTGLRIGVSTAKGFCFSLGIPLISIDTLTALAYQVKVSNGLIIPMIDARRMEVYSAVFDEKHNKIRPVIAEIIDNNYLSNSSEIIYIVGDCQEKIKSVLSNSNIIYLEDIVYPSANEMGLLSYIKFKNNDFEDIAYFEPFYLKDFLISNSK